MSNAPAAVAKKEATAETPPPKGERMRKVNFVSQGIPLAGVNDWKHGATARQNTVSQGVDIYFVLDERRYRFDIYTSTHEGIVKTSTKYMHESRIDTAEAWDA